MSQLDRRRPRLPRGSTLPTATYWPETAQRYFFTLLLALSIIQFSTAWWYGGADVTNINTDDIQPYSIPFRYALWSLIATATIVCVKHKSINAVIIASTPFMPLLFSGIIAAVFGHSLPFSMKMIALWALMAASAISIGLSLETKNILNTINISNVALLILSSAVSILAPDIGQLEYGDSLVWRGIFLNKNHLGVLAMWALVCAFISRRDSNLIIAYVAIALSGMCLVMSGNRGSMIIAISALVFFLIIQALLRLRISATMASSLMIAGLVLIVTITLLFWEPVMTALGRDPTMTGRTIIWSVYLDRILEHWFLGEGPGAFTSASEITGTLFFQLEEWGPIRQPHNMYIGALGDGGIIGLLCYSGLLIYLGFVFPFVKRTGVACSVAVASYTLMIGGMIEGRGVYTSSLDGFLLILLFAMATRSSLLEGGKPSLQRR